MEANTSSKVTDWHVFIMCKQCEEVFQIINPVGEKCPTGEHQIVMFSVPLECSDCAEEENPHLRLVQ